MQPKQSSLGLEKILPLGSADFEFGALKYAGIGMVLLWVFLLYAGSERRKEPIATKAVNEVYLPRSKHSEKTAAFLWNK